MKEYLLFLFQMSFEVALSKGVSLLFQAYASEVVSEEYHALSLSVVRLLFILLLAMFTSSSLIFFLACLSGKYIERYRTDNRPCYWRLSCSGSLHSKLCLYKFHIPYIFLIGLLGFCFMLLSLQKSILIYFHRIQFLGGIIFIIHSKMQFQMLAK